MDVLGQALQQECKTSEGAENDTAMAWVGTVGVAAIVVTYLLLQLGRIDPRGLPYSGLNALGSALIPVSLTAHFNMSAAVIKAFWLAISLDGIGAWARRRALQRGRDRSG